MTKNNSIIYTAIIAFVVLCLAVFAFLPFGFGAYGEYYSANGLIQKGVGYGNSTKATYKIIVDEFADGVTVDNCNIADAVKARLAAMYGYYNCTVDMLDNNQVAITIPETTNKNGTEAKNILSAVTVDGVIEILNSSSYSQDAIGLSNKYDHFGKTSIKRYVSGSESYYIVDIEITELGYVSSNGIIATTTSSLNNYCAIDGAVAFLCAYNGSYVSVYTTSEYYANMVKSFVDKGALDGCLVNVKTETVEAGATMLIVYLALLGIIVAGSIFFIVRFNSTGIAGVLSVLIASVLFMYFSGLVYFTVLNTGAVVGMVCALALIGYLCFRPLETMRKFIADNKSYSAAAKMAFNSALKENIILNAIVLVVGIILWCIKAAFTVSLGNVLVYGAVISALVTLLVNRLLVSLVAPMAE